MKLLAMTPAGLLFLIALLWIPSTTMAQEDDQSSGPCTPDPAVTPYYLKLADKAAKGAVKGKKASAEFDQVIAELEKLSKRCGNLTKLGRSIERTLNDAKARRDKLKKSGERAKKAVEKMKAAKKKKMRDPIIDAEGDELVPLTP